MKLQTTLFAILIASVCWAQGLQPNDSTALLKVHVKSTDGYPAPGQYITFINPETKVELFGTSNDTGYFELLIPQGVTYDMVVAGFKGEENRRQVEMPSPGGPYAMDLTVTTESAMTLDITFNTNSAELNPNSYAEIDKLHTWILSKNNIRVEIAGHTDSDGSDAANLTLSQARAESVRKYLLQKGVAANRIIAKGYGESKPITSNDTAQGKAKNRRTEVRILAQ